MNIIKQYAQSQVDNRNFKSLTHVYAFLAKGMNLDKETVIKWVFDFNEITAERVLQLEKITGIGRSDLRPDIYPKNLNEIVYECDQHLSLKKWIKKESFTRIVSNIYDDLSEQIGVGAQGIRNWSKPRLKIPAKYVLKLEKITDGVVSRGISRPDLYPKDLESRQYDVPIFEKKLTIDERLTNIENLLSSICKNKGK